MTAAPYTSIAEGRRIVVALCVTAFLSTLMYASLAPFFSELKVDLNTSTPALGQVVTARLLLSAGLAIFAGPIADRYGYRRLIVLGLLSLSLTFFGVSASQSYFALLLTGIPGGLAGGVLSGLPLAIAANTFTGEARLKAISYTVAALSSSAIVGVPALTTASAEIGWRGVFLASGIVGLVCTIGVGWALPADEPREQSEPLSLRALSSAYTPLLANKPVMRLYGSTFLRSIGWLGFLTYLGAYLADDVGFSTRQIGLVYMIGGIGYFAGSLLAGQRQFGSSIATIAAGMTIITGFMVSLAIAASSMPWLVIAAICGVTLTSSVAWVLFTTLLTSTTTAGQGTTMSFNATVSNLGSAAGGIAGGALIALSGYLLLGMGLAIALIASAVLIVTGASTGRLRFRRTRVTSNKEAGVAVTPYRPDEMVDHAHDRDAYQDRSMIERSLNRLKRRRRVATYFESGQQLSGDGHDRDNSGVDLALLRL
jgi:predicted MFS family arabinose efflux permease